MSDKSQRINGMTFQSEAEAKEWIAQNVPFAERSNLTVSNVRPEEACDGQLENFQSGNDLDGLEFQQVDQADGSNRASIDLTPQNEEERVEFEKFVCFIKPRIENALNRRFSNRTIDEIFEDVENEMKKSNSFISRNS